MARDLRVLEVIYSAVDFINENRPIEEHLDKAPETLLFGEGGQLDSLDLVELLAETESRIEDALVVSIVLANEKALSYKHNPFRSIGELADYATSLLHEARSQDESL